MSASHRRRQHREVLRLAVPAFLALVAEPLFLLADSAIVGRLGAEPLAGLGVASAVLLTAANVFVFLAYGTTSVVARQLGAGSRAGALAAGIDGAWLARGPRRGDRRSSSRSPPAPCAGLFGASPAAPTRPTTYLRVAAFGLPAMLVVLATTGVLRGLQDTRTPLVAAVAGFSANAGLSCWFVYGLGWGIAGSAWGTVIAQTGMALALVGRPRPGGRAGTGAAAGPPGPGAGRRPRRACRCSCGPWPCGGSCSLTTWVAAGLGDVPLAAYQVTATIWSFLTFALDALAIAAQAITGRTLGAGDLAHPRRDPPHGPVGGARRGRPRARGAVVRPSPAAVHPGRRRSRPPSPRGLLVVALGQPLSGFVFVVDGVLIGAGDGRWLARAMLATLRPTCRWCSRCTSPGDWLLEGGSAPVRPNAVVWLWLAFTGFMAVRGTLMWMRVRTDHWMVTGAAP